MTGHLLTTRRLLGAWLCGLVLLAAIGMPWLALIHAAEHQSQERVAAMRRDAAAISARAEHDERDCVICGLLATATTPVDQPGDAPEPIGCVAVSPLDLPFARGPPVALVCFAPLARGPPSVVVIA